MEMRDITQISIRIRDKFPPDQLPEQILFEIVNILFEYLDPDWQEKFDKFYKEKYNE